MSQQVVVAVFYSIVLFVYCSRDTQHVVPP